MSDRRALVAAYRARLQAQLVAAPATFAGPPIRLAQPANPAGLNWIPLGPAAVLGGPSTTRPVVSGPVTAVAVSAGGDRVYAASWSLARPLPA